MKICPLGDAVFHAKGRTDRHRQADMTKEFCELA